MTMSWEASVIFEKDEKIVGSWHGNRETVERVVMRGQYGRRAQDVKTRKNGILTLTNQRILFLEEHGLFGKSYHQVLAVPLLKVGGIAMGGTISPFVSIADEMETHIFHLDGIGKNEFDEFRRLVVSCCQRRREEIEAAKRKDKIQIMLDFSMLKEYMEKGGLVLQKTKCPECGAPIPLPTVGNQISCPHCGSMILAQDVFEKIKSLL
jgi:DNA-directed RNA polymerase subunit RPC12/RpoP